MNRLLTLASGGLFAAGLTILPLAAFAQQGGADAKTTAPMTQPDSTADATPKVVKTHRAKHVATPVSNSAGVAKTTTGTHAPPTTQPKAAEQGKL